MKGKILYFSIITAAILVLSLFPNIPSMNIQMENSNPKNVSEITDNENTKPITFKLYNVQEDGTCMISKRTLSSSEVEKLEEELKALNQKDTSLYEIFQEKFNILKRYKFIPDGITLEDVIDPGILNYDINVVSDEDFDATTAPIFFFGGGLGAGIGIPFFLTAGAFLVALFGFGLTLCYDLFSNTLYQLYTPSFTPILLGFLVGFVGLILLPVIPGFIYSNFFAIGAVAYTRWIQWSPF